MDHAQVSANAGSELRIVLSPQVELVILGQECAVTIERDLSAVRLTRQSSRFEHFAVRAAQLSATTLVALRKAPVGSSQGMACAVPSAGMVSRAPADTQPAKSKWRL
eukprot:5770359-Prymnesium_polylepis.2